LATVRLRWQEPETDEVIEAERTLLFSDVQHNFAAADPRFQLAAAVAEFAEILKDSPYAEGSTLANLAEEIDRIEEEIETAEGVSDRDVADLREMVWTADELDE
jgi:Ca-activated chloride channel family protein